jgi:DNA repair protein RecO (recombination protein O)
MALRHDQGIVLRSYPFGEADRVVVILSPNHGRLRAVAKGVRKTKSRFGGRLEPFTHVDLVLYEGRHLDTITQAAVIEAFPRLRSDLDRVLMAGTMVEAADAVAEEGESSLRLFLLLQRGLRALEAGAGGPDLITAFLLKLADVAGIGPTFDRCAACGSPEGLERFSFSGGGVMCRVCGAEGGLRLRPGVIRYLSTLARTDLEALPEPDAALAGEARGVARRFLEHHLERRLATLAAIDG